MEFYTKCRKNNIKPIIGLNINYSINNQESSLLLYAKMRDADIKMVTRDFVIQVVYNGSVSLEGKCGAHLSIFALGGVAEGVCISGARYELCNRPFSVISAVRCRKAACHFRQQ